MALPDWVPLISGGGSAVLSAIVGSRIAVRATRRDRRSNRDDRAAERWANGIEHRLERLEDDLDDRTGRIIRLEESIRQRPPG